MIDLVVVLFDLDNDINKIIKCIKQQTYKPDNVIFVLNGVSIENKIKEEIKKDAYFSVCFFDYVNKKNFIHDVSSDVKNFGLSKSVGDIVILIDSDCLPQRKLIEGHVENCKYGFPIVSCGLVREKIYRWDDKRKETMGDLFSKNTIINNISFVDDGVINSKNIAFNRKFLNMLYLFNEKYYGERCIFNTSLDNYSADVFLGVSSWLSRAFIVTAPKSSVERINKKADSEKPQVEYMKKMINELKLRISINPLSLDFFSLFL